MNVFSVLEGNIPVILAQPHGGTHVPEDILAKLNDRGKALVDTDWHINRLYDGLLEDVTVVQSHSTAMLSMQIGARMTCRSTLDKTRQIYVH